MILKITIYNNNNNNNDLFICVCVCSDTCTCAYNYNQLIYDYIRSNGSMLQDSKVCFSHGDLSAAMSPSQAT